MSFVHINDLTMGHQTFSHRASYLWYRLTAAFQTLHFMYRSFATRVSVSTQNLAFLSYWYRKKCLQMYF